MAAIIAVNVAVLCVIMLVIELDTGAIGAFTLATYTMCIIIVYEAIMSIATAGTLM